MSVTFTKLFSSITESTVWCEDSNTRIVWIAMLAMCDRNGRVWGSIPGLANRARVPVEDCREAISKFLNPDPDSRTKDHEGRRIVEIDGGWLLLNHEKYRNLRDEEERKEYKREWIKEKRRQSRQNVDSVDRSRPQYTNADADADADKSKRVAIRSRRAPENFIPDHQFAIDAIPDIDAEAEVKKFKDWEFKTPRSDWPATWRNWIRSCMENGKYAKRAGSHSKERGLVV
jgi:hypothetical protein